MASLRLTSFAPNRQTLRFPSAISLSLARKQMQRQQRVSCLRTGEGGGGVMQVGAGVL